MSSQSRKWVKGLSSTMSVANAATLVFRRRMREVRGLLPEAATSGDRHAIHQLRVATRRMSAALLIFRDWTDPKQRRRTNHVLREIRRAAGDAREADVHGMEFARWIRECDADVAAGAGYLLGRLEQVRTDAQQQVQHVAREISGDVLKRRCRRLIASVEAPGKRHRRTALQDLAERRLPKLARAVEDAGRRDLSDIHNVHAMRISGKRLRYGVEILACCFDPDEHAALYARITAFQDRLGGINDISELRAHVATTRAGVRVGGQISLQCLDAVTAMLDDRLHAEHAAFVDWWQDVGIDGLIGDVSNGTAQLLGREATGLGLETALNEAIAAAERNAGDTSWSMGK
ncbi:MAG: CHAD domain-containing protein [Planctomycetota bacterium]